MSEWIKHTGGKMPVDGDTMVEVISYVSDINIAKASDVHWRSVSEYRILEPQDKEFEESTVTPTLDEDIGKFNVDCNYHRRGKTVVCDYGTQKRSDKEIITSLPFAPNESTINMTEENGRTYVMYEIKDEPQQTTLDYQIEVMQAYRDGAKVKYKNKIEGKKTWEKTECPSWNWVLYDYGIIEEPKTRTIHGVELPLPVSEPLEDGEEYWCVSIQSEDTDIVDKYFWDDNLIDRKWLERGLIYKTKQEAQQVADYIINKVLKVEG